MKLLRAVVATAICAGLATPSWAEELKIEVFAHYVSWHRESPYQNTIATDGTTHPLRSGGGYDSLDSAIIREHNEEFEKYGISPFISWWGPVGSVLESSGDLFLDAYLASPSKVKCIIAYEATERLVGQVRQEFGKEAEVFDFNDPRNASRFMEDMDHLYAKYLSNPKYKDRFVTRNGKPVVYIWISHAFRGRFDLASSQVSGRKEIFLVGSNFNVFGSVPNDTHVIGGLDAVSAYGVYSADLAVIYGGHLGYGYVQQYQEGVARWSLWLSRNLPHVPLFLPLQFTYNDFPHRGNPKMELTTKEEAEHFALTVRQIVVNSHENCRNVWPYVFVVSYNEHYEGSSIEPSVEYGYDFIDVVRDVFKQPVPVIPRSCGQ